jgi:hypothetical protein
MTAENPAAAMLELAPFALAALRGGPLGDGGVRQYLSGLLTDAVLDGLDALLARDPGKIALAYPLALTVVELGSSARDARYWRDACERTASLARDRSTVEDVILAMYRRRALPAADPLASVELPYLKAQVMDRALWYLAARRWIGAAAYDPRTVAVLLAAARRSADAGLVAKLTCAGYATGRAHTVLAAAAQGRAPVSPLITLASLVREQNAEQPMESVA